MWSDQDLAYYEGEGYTIRDAINYWYWNVSNTNETVVFRDECSGPHCSNVCPEEISLETGSGAVVWSGATRMAIATTVLLISIICLVMKVSFHCRYYWVGIFIPCNSHSCTVLSGSSISVGGSRSF